MPPTCQKLTFSNMLVEVGVFYPVLDKKRPNGVAFLLSLLKVVYNVIEANTYLGG